MEEYRGLAKTCIREYGKSVGEGQNRQNSAVARSVLKIVERAKVQPLSAPAVPL